MPWALGIAWGLYLALLVFGVPRAEAVFLDFGAPLPRATALIIRLSRGAVALAPVLLLFVAADWLMLSGKFTVRVSQRWPVAMLGLPWLLMALTLAGLVLPLLTVEMRLTG